jgi:hypothetical protein
LSLPKEIWDDHRIGDDIEVVYVAKGGMPYHRDGIYASDGNFIVDYGILAVEFGMIAFALVVPLTYWFSRRRRRKERDTPVSG